MNDFTKDELKYLLGALNNLHVNYLPSLVPKMETMIKNYCDHEWENTCCLCSLSSIYCHKCEADMGKLKARYSDE